MPALMTATAYAAHRGVVKSAVSNWKKRELIVWAEDETGKLLIDVLRTDAKLNANVDPTKGRPTTGQAALPLAPSQQSQLQDDVSKVRTDLIRAQTESKLLENARRAGSLVAIAEYEARAAEIGRLARERMHSMVRQLSERLASESEPRAIIALLSERIDQVFGDLADKIDADAREDAAADAAAESLTAEDDDLVEEALEPQAHGGALKRSRRPV
jgi:hypothetical protein